jgi:DNA mismatch endonuclease (patch repair protein)
MRSPSQTSNRLSQGVPIDRPSASNPSVRRRMQATRRRDTPLERQIRSMLHRLGYRFRVDISPLPTHRSRADIVFSRFRVAVYVDGCFWHGCPIHGTWPKANRDWWRDKIETNRRRDRTSTEALLASGWAVVRIWEHEDATSVINTIVSELRSRSGQLSGGNTRIAKKAE